MRCFDLALLELRIICIQLIEDVGVSVPKTPSLVFYLSLVAKTGKHAI